MNDKEQKKKVETYHDGYSNFCICPLCKEKIQAVNLSPIYKRPNYCQHCGQALDWSDIK